MAGIYSNAVPLGKTFQGPQPCTSTPTPAWFYPESLFRVWDTIYVTLLLCYSFLFLTSVPQKEHFCLAYSQLL